jgi:hypothetical protein
MTQLADSKLSALQTLTGSTGHIQDLEAEYLVLLGATASRAIVDQWHEVFDNAAIAAGQHNDRWMAYMDSILSPATEDAYNDREREYWDGGGTPIGPPPPPVPPKTANLQYWFDYTDNSQVFSDAAGTIQAIQGSECRRINDKGSNGNPIIENTAFVPEYDLTNPIGLNCAGLSGFSAEANPDVGGTTGAAGITIAAVMQRQDVGATLRIVYRMLGGGGNLRIEIDSIPIAAQAGWQVHFSDAGGPLFAGSETTGEWLYIVATINASTGAYVIRNGTDEFTGTSIYAAFTPIQTQIGQLDGCVGEVLIWDVECDSTDLDAIEAYFNAKYGPLPETFLPPTVVGLIHHYDFTDNLSVFRNPSATQLARDGDTIRVLKDKGFNAADLTTPNGTDAPTYRTDYVNGENVADFSPGTNSKPMTGLDIPGHLGVKGMTNAIIFRLEDPLGPLVELVDWGFGAGRVRGVRAFGGGFMEWDYPGPVGAFSLGTILPGFWYLWYASFTGAAVPLDDRAKLSGEASQSLSGITPTDIAPGEPITIKHLSVQNYQIAEWAVWDGPLTDPELALLVAYGDAKYGTLPHGNTSIPAVSNLLHHVDPTDPSTVFADAAGLIPATNGVTVERIDNKGTRGTPFLRVGFGGVVYRTDVLNSENVIEFSSANGQLTIAAESPGLAISTTGCTLAMVVRRRQALGAGTGILWRWTPFGGVPGPGLRHASTSEDFITIIDGIANEILKAATALDTWYLIYISIDPAGAVDDAVFGSPGPEVVAAIGNPTDIPDLADVRWGTSIATMESAEAFFWDRPLTLAERAQLVAYADGKYGILPHL